MILCSSEAHCIIWVLETSHQEGFSTDLRNFQDRNALNLEEHVVGTTLAMRLKEQAHFWLSTINYEYLSLL